MRGSIHRVSYFFVTFFSNGCRFFVNVTGNTHKGFAINRVSSDCIDTFVLMNSVVILFLHVMLLFLGLVDLDSQLLYMVDVH